MDFRTKLIKVRKANGLTQEELAAKSNITSRTIQRIEAGTVEPRAHTIRTLSKALEFDFFDPSENVQGHPAFWHIIDLFNLKTHKMRKISILSITAITLVVSALLIQAEPSDKKKPSSSIAFTYNKDNSLKRVDVAFTNDLTLDSLVNMKKRLSAVNITVSYTFMEFDKAGHLTGIGCNVTDSPEGKGSSGSFKTPAIKTTGPTGFYYDYTKNVKDAFCCGSCWRD